MGPQSGQEHIVHAVAAGLAVLIKAGAVREGEPATAFARQAGLGEAGAADAWRHASRRAQAGPPEVLVPSAAALGRMSSSLDAVAPGLGAEWRARIAAACATGVTPMAQWLRSLPGALEMGSDSGRAAAGGREDRGVLPAAVPPAGSTPAAEGVLVPEAFEEDDVLLSDAELEETEELTFDDMSIGGSPAADPIGDAPDGAGALEGPAPDDDEGDDLLGLGESVDDLLDDDSIDLDDDMMDDPPEISGG